MSFPVWYTPLTTAQLKLFSSQKGLCAEYEMDYYRCASRVGHRRSEYDCKKEYEDFLECSSKTKQFKRYVAMQEERKKQGRKPLTKPLVDIAGVV